MAASSLRKQTGRKAGNPNHPPRKKRKSLLTPENPPKDQAFSQTSNSEEESVQEKEDANVSDSHISSEGDPFTGDILSGSEDDEEENGAEAEKEDDNGIRGKERSNVLPMLSYDVKLRELLRNICSIEVAIYSQASKEFVRLLRGDSGGELLCQYVRDSPSCMELMEVWKLQQGKPGMAHILSLISAILDHPGGKYHIENLGRLPISRRLDRLAHSIVELKLEDIYTELNSREAKRQSSALYLMAVIVRRGVGLASEVAKRFDFKLAMFPKLAEIPLKKGGKDVKYSTRPAFIEFAMSFLEVGNPRLLRWILQQKDMYFGVLRGLGSDDEKTVVYVLSKLRDKVLSPQSSVPVGLRSVLFGSVTLEQLSGISGNPVGGLAAEMAHEILVMVCTDSCNGLMPDWKCSTNSLRGNPKRLLGLTKKLKATEIGYHRSLLLAIVNGRPSLGSAYMGEFPYSLEPRPSHLWFAAISLAADLISSATAQLPFASLLSDSCCPPPLGNLEIQCILKCLVPRAFTRLVSNRGLLHSDITVKHGSLRLLLEALKSLDNLIGAIDNALENMRAKGPIVTIPPWLSKLKGLQGFSNLGNVNRSLDNYGAGKYDTYNPVVQKLVTLKQEIQNEMRAMLPDPQVLLKLLSSLNHDHSGLSYTSLKRRRAPECLSEVKSRDDAKKLRSDSIGENIDIIIGGISSEHCITAPRDYEEVKDDIVVEEVDTKEDHMIVLAEIWGSHEFSMIGSEQMDFVGFFRSKLFVAFHLFLRTLPFGLEGSFDFFKMLPNNPLTLPICEQRSLLSLLIEYIGESRGSRVSIRAPDLLYKHLQPLINLLMYSPVKDIRDQAYVLAHAALQSTGAFDKNLTEIDAWLLFLPIYNKDKSSTENEGDKAFQELSTAAVSFICDAVSTVGNNLYKYLDHTRYLISKLDFVQDLSLDFSPLVVCILQKCLRLLESDSGTFKLPERSMVSLYVCNALCFILQTQVEVRPLSVLIDSILTEKFDDLASEKGNPWTSLCEWRPLKKLLLFAQSILHQQVCCSSFPEETAIGDGHSILKMLGKIKKIKERGLVVGSDKVGSAFLSAILCAKPDDLLENFPLLVTVAHQLLGEHISFLSSLFFLERNLLPGVANRWPDLFVSGLEMVGTMMSSSYEKDDSCLQGIDFDSVDSAATAFSLLLNHTPFHALFCAMTTLRNSNLLGSIKVLDLLKNKLSECPMDSCISLMRLLLFWVHQVQSSFRAQPSSGTEQLLEICLILVEHLLTHLLVVPSDLDSSKMVAASPMTTCILELVETIFCHPAVTLPLSNPLSSKEELWNKYFADSLEGFVCLSRQSIHSTDHHIFDLLKKVADFMLCTGNGQGSTSGVCDAAYRPAINALKLIISQAVLAFKEKFDLCIMTENWIPFLQSFYIFHALMCFISPFELLELADWVFLKVDQHDPISWKSSRLSTLSVGIYITHGACDLLSTYLHQRQMVAIACNLFWEMEGRNFDFSLLEKVYYKIIEYAIRFRVECADLCLLKVVNAVYNTKYMPPVTYVLPLSMAMSRMIISSPMDVLIHFIHGTSKIKAKALYQLTEVSHLHLSFFGQVFLDILNKDLTYVDALKPASTLPLTGDIFLRNCSSTLSDNEFLLLLPVALSYLISTLAKFGKGSIKHLRCIPLFYSRILLSSFPDWSSCVSGNIFQEEYDEFMPRSMEEFLSICTSSLLGKAIHMLRYHFSLNENQISNKKRLKVFDSMYPHSNVHNELLGCDLNDIDAHSLKSSFNFTNSIVAKISLSRMLLFPQDKTVHFPIKADERRNALPSETVSDNCSHLMKLRFINLMVSALDKIVKTFNLSPGNSIHLNGSDCSQLFRYLEIFILRNIVQICKEMRSELTQLHVIPFLEPFIRSSLLHRFEDPMTLKALRSVLISLSEGKFSANEVLELLLGHSQFVPTILWSDSVSDSSVLCDVGSLSRPVSSILKMLIFPSTDQSTADAKDFNGMPNDQHSLYKRKLEVVKLLRALYHLKANQCSACPRKDACMNPSELLSLLLSSYGATLNEIDLEIFNLMYEIESFEESDSGSIAEMDYLWGSSALKIRREQVLDRFLLSSTLADSEAAEERRRRQYRENIPVDFKVCVMTVLHFCYDRVAQTGPMSMEKLQEDILDSPEIPSTNTQRIQLYDPSFILRFSIHGLSMGYIEPMEFASLGLLAVAFVSLSSLDEGMRKLGYEVLGKYKSSLENCRSSRDALRLRLLLTYLQNGIAEPWQKIPSPITIFVAEASYILLDPSHDHYLTVSKFIMRSPRVDVKSIPLFNAMFESSSVTSVQFRVDCLWILRLLYASLNLGDDAQIFMRKHILEHLLSFSLSSIPDYDLKFLILQILKKAVKLHRLACYLVEHCGLISWLSSNLSFCGDMPFQDHKDIYLAEATIVLEVVNVVISSRTIIDWMQKYGLEQLSELSSNLYLLFVGGLRSLRANVELLNSTFGIWLSTLRISQKRKIYQPHFTLSVDGLFQIFQAVDEFSDMRFGLTAELGLKTILMNTPPATIFLMDGEKLSKLLMWAVSSARQSCLSKDCDPNMTLSDEQIQDSVVSKLLRWLTASVILGRISSNSSKIVLSFPQENSRIKTLQSLLEHLKDRQNDCWENIQSSVELVAAILLYLQQLAGANSDVLPSVISALCLLFSSHAANLTGHCGIVDPLNGENSSWFTSQSSKIRCPVEANPAWRWSYYQPWKDLSWEPTDAQKADEHCACQTLIAMFSNAFVGKSLGQPVLSHQDMGISRLFVREREIIIKNE